METTCGAEAEGKAILPGDSSYKQKTTFIVTFPTTVAKYLEKHNKRGKVYFG